MAADTVLDLLLTARYVGGPAFAQMGADIDALVGKTDGFQKLGAAFDALGNIMIAGGLAAAVGIGAAVDQAMKYEDSLQRIVAISPDHLSATLSMSAGVDSYTNSLIKGRTELAALNNEISAASTKWAINPQDMAQAQYNLFSSLGALGPQQGTPANLLANNIPDLLAQYVRASGPTGSGVSYGDAAQLVPRLMVAAGLPMSQWGGGMGMMTFLENRTHTTQSQLVNAANAFLPTMVDLGIPFDQALTYLAATGTNGRVGAPAGREAMSALTLMFAGSTQQSELKQLGLSTDMFFKNGQMLPMPQVMSMLQYGIYSHAKSPADVQSIEHNLFGQVGLRALGPLLSPQGFTKYQNLIADEKKYGVYNNPAGAQAYMGMVATGAMQSPQAQFQSLLYSIQLLGIALGKTLMPVVLQVVNAFKQLVLSLTGFVNDHPQLTKALATAAVPALLGGGVGMKGLGGLFSMLGTMNVGIKGRNAKAMEDFLKGEGGGSLNGLQNESWRELQLTKMPGKMGAMGWYQSPLTPKEFDMRAANYTEAHGNIVDKLINQPTLEKTIGQRLLAPWQGLANMGARGGGVIGKGLVYLTRGEGIEETPAPLGERLGGLAEKAKGGAVSGITSVGSKLLEIFKSIPGAIAKVAMALPAIAAAGAPVVLVILLIVGAITTIVLLFTHFRQQGMQIAQFLGSIFGPAFKAVFGMAGQMIGQLGQTWKQVEPQVSAAMKQLVAGIQSARPFFVALAAIFVLVGAIIIGVIGNLIGAFIKMLPTIIAIFTGIFRIIGDITNFIIALVTGQWGKIPGIIGGLFGDVLNLLKNLGGLILGFIGGFIGGILGWFHSLWDKLVGHSIIPDLINGIIHWFLSLPGNILGMLGDFVGSVLGHIGHLKDMAIFYIHYAIDLIIYKFITFKADVLKHVQDAINNVLGFLQGVPTSLFTAGQNIINALINGLKNALGGLDNIVQTVSQKLSNIPGVGGILNVVGSHIPHFAAGGTMPYSGFAMVGERGPEMVKLPGGSHVFPHGVGFSGVMSGPMRIGELHVDAIHMPAPRQPQYQPLAETMTFSRQVQAEREGSYSRYGHNLGQFDADFRRSWQYTQ